MAICCFEDKIVQQVLSQILGAIYEPLFLEGSFGFRPKKSCHQAMQQLSQTSFQVRDGAIVEIDLRKYFNTIPHDKLLAFLKGKISDHRFVRLLEIMLKAPTLDGTGNTLPNVCGTPQGSILLAVLSNIFLHHVIDVWFKEISLSHMTDKCWEIRYADDMVFVFKSSEDANRFYSVLGKRLATEMEKHNADRMRGKLKGLKDFLQYNLNTLNLNSVLKKVVAGVRDWIEYHAVSDNNRAIAAFIQNSKHILRRWNNRRGRKSPMNWDKFNKLCEKIAFPKYRKLKSLFLSTPKQILTNRR